MGSLGQNLLEYFRTKTQVDIDSFDIFAAKEHGPYADATSNQAEVYTELVKESNEAIVSKAISFAASVHSKFPEVTIEALAVEIAAISFALRIVPYITGAFHVMANPRKAYSTQAVVQNGKRYHQILKLLDPTFDPSRMVMKVAATWEGLQACRHLRSVGIKTLATTVFTMEQSILAGEVGCVSLSPFCHELKIHFEESYHDIDPIMSLCVQAQHYYQQNSMPTKVKACSTVGLDEILQLAGVAAMTIMPNDIAALASTMRSEEAVASLSLFNNKAIAEIASGPVYMDDEAKYRKDFSANGDGLGQYKLMQALAIFCDYQDKSEAWIRELGGK